MAVAYVGIAFVAEAPLSERTVRQALQRSQGRPGAGRLELIGDGLANGATRFEAERRFRRLLRAAELPRPDFNVRVGPYLVDALWPEHRLAALKVLRFTWRRITRHPVAVAATVARELALRSGS